MKKRLVGGDYLLDLTPIELEESVDVETYTNITNAEILEQLTNLKKYVPNPSMVKPVWVKLRNGETDEVVVVRGEFKVVDAGEFEIVAFIDGYKLKIHIEFTQALDENNDPIDDWYIDTNDAKYLFTSDLQNIGNVIGTGEIDNAKPVYFHPIVIVGGSSEADPYSLYIEILDNNNEEYNTTTKVKNKMLEIATAIESTARIGCAGSYYNRSNSATFIPSHIDARYTDNKLLMYGMYLDGNRTYIDITDLVFTSVYDGVNKIN